MNLDCFKIDKKEFYINDVKDRPDVFDLLTFGKLNKGKIFESIANGFDNLYFINRGYAKKIISEIEKGTHNIVIDSDIGNGKSILLESLKAYYTHKNTRCYTLKNENDKIDAELCEIYKNTEKQIIFIDGIHKYKDVFKRAQFQRPTNTFFVMAERTALAEIDSRFISEICGEDIYSVSVNRIEDDDLKDVITLLRTHGLLGIFSKFQDERCFSEFKENNLASFLNIILYLYDNSEHIKEKLYTIIEDIENKSGYSQLLAAIFIASFLRSDLNLNDILEITKMTGNKSIIFQSDSSVRQLVDTDYNTINAKSSILAQYILSNKMLPNDIISMLINIYEFCAKNKHKNTEYYEIIDELNRFSTIQRILSKENLLDESIIYFEAIKKYNRNERNPSFWLQYAIAHTVNNSYIRAGEFFKTAKSYLGKEQYGTKLYIDNYYARYLLQRCIHDHRYYDFEDFKTVKVIVNQQIIDQETLYYPYRIIVNYKTFYDNFKSTFTKEQKEFILNHCTHVIKNSKVPPYSNRNYYRIKESIDSLNLLISELEKEI